MLVRPKRSKVDHLLLCAKERNERKEEEEEGKEEEEDSEEKEKEKEGEGDRQWKQDEGKERRKSKWEPQILSYSLPSHLFCNEHVLKPKSFFTKLRSDEFN